MGCNISWYSPSVSWHLPYLSKICISVTKTWKSVRVCTWNSKICVNCPSFVSNCLVERLSTCTLVPNDLPTDTSVVPNKMDDELSLRLFWLIVSKYVSIRTLSHEMDASTLPSNNPKNAIDKKSSGQFDLLGFFSFSSRRESKRNVERLLCVRDIRWGMYVRLRWRKIGWKGVFFVILWDSLLKIMRVTHR